MLMDFSSSPLQCHAIHRTLIGDFKYALVWYAAAGLAPFLPTWTLSAGIADYDLRDSPYVSLFFIPDRVFLMCLLPHAHPHRGRSTKYSPQRVGLSHTLDNEDVIQIVKKSNN